ncbi:MAG: hypothetical protein FWD68_02525, partial [Alphaproteobacteria bacterium]|nr:hypothetical protein [Alphaproteobacteria bacterium]
APGPLLEQFGLEAAGPENTENTAQSTAADIRSTVESEFREIAAVKRDVKLKDLRQVAAQGVERLVLYKGSAKQIIATAAIALICASGTAIAARSGPSVAAWMVALCWALTLLFLAFTVTTWRQRNRRFMTLTADGLRFGNLPSPMPWRAITSTSIKTMWINGTSVPFAILVDLSRDFPAPSPRPGRFSGIAYVAAKHQFILTTGNTLRVSSKAAIESRDLEMLFGDFNRTWQAGLARAELARMGEAFAPGTEHHPA